MSVREEAASWLVSDADSSLVPPCKTFPIEILNPVLVLLDAGLAQEA